MTAAKKIYKQGDAVFTDEGLNLGQYIKNEKEFITSDPDFLKKSFREMGNYALAHNIKDASVFKIFCKRKIYNEEIGTKEQYLIELENDLKWIELKESDYKIEELDI